MNLLMNGQHRQTILAYLSPILQEAEQNERQTMFQFGN